MTPEHAHKRIESLRADLRRHNRLYYVEATQEITDREYDLLYAELKLLEEQFPQFVTEDSPTRRVGGEPIKEFTRFRHLAPMLSLEKKEDLRELELFETEIRRKLPDAQPSFVVEPKIDGVSISIHYVDGVLATGVTRGDGEFGDDITVNLRTIPDIPLRLEFDGPPPVRLEVRGEAYMIESDRIALNEGLRERGEKTFANTRNATAGSLKQLDPRIVAQRRLHAVFYAVGATAGISFASHTEELETFRKLGLSTPKLWARATSMKEAEAAALDLKAHEDELPYEIDGFVIKVDDNETCRRLGLKTNVPAYAVAYKRPEWFSEATTKLRAITVQVGRTGVLAPVGEVETVFLDGTNISRVTLHNADEIARKGIRIGDTVVIKRAGKVIPAIVRVVDDQRTGAEQTFTMPDRCPSCGGPVHQRKLSDGDRIEVALRCENEDCPEQQARQIEYFASRAALNIEGLGEIVADSLVRRDLAKTPFDLFGLQLETLATLNLGTDEEPRQLGEKTARKILDALEAARKAPLNKWLYALGLPSVGEATALALAAGHDDVAALADSPKLRRLVQLAELREEKKRVNPRARSNKNVTAAEKAELERQHEAVTAKIDQVEREVAQDGLGREVGPAVAAELLAYFSSPRGQKLVAGFSKLGIQFERTAPPAAPADSSSPFFGKTAVITGTLQGLSREAAQAELRKRGAKVTDSVSSKTDFLIVGADAGSKLAKAQKLGVRIVEEAEFKTLLGL